MSRYGRRRLSALFLVASALLASCGSSGTGKSGSTSATSPGSTGDVSSGTVSVKQGGDVTLGAEQEPQCMDWLAPCASSPWGIYMLESNTMPRAYDYTPTGYRPSILLSGPATVTTRPHQVVTYHINPKAVWNDGQPITSSDFSYTWDQVMHGGNVSSTAGYSSIASVNDSDPHTAVVTFAKPYADWQQLFGGYFGILPSHILADQDRDSAMRNGYTFSGGPWELQHWTRGQSLILVPNPRYWGKHPDLSSVTFDFITDPAEELQEFRSGQISAIYPQPEPDVTTLVGLPNTAVSASPGLSFEALWFNVQSAPVNSLAVREALAYSTDRTAIASMFAKLGPGVAAPVQSTFTPAFGAVYSQPFAPYHRALAEVDHLMTADGWARAGNGVWTKGGQPAAVQIKTTAGDPRRQAITHMIQAQWQSAGFEVSVVQESPAALFGDDLPSGNFTVALYSLTSPDNDPGQCVIWCSSSIPTNQNHYVGQNYTRTAVPALDALWSDVDTNLDTAARISDANRAETILAGLVPVLPLEVLPDILAVNTSMIGIEGGRFQVNPAFGPFADLNDWYVK